MKALYLTLFISLSVFSYAATRDGSVLKTNKFFIQPDSLIIPATLDEDSSKRVIISAGDNNLEISPLSAFNNGLLIEPVNRVAEKGVSSVFYIRDTASWSFYTNAQQRLSISGNGLIAVSSPVMINMQSPDSINMLRVNGNARVDSSFTVQGELDTVSMISLHRNIKSAYIGEDDGVSPYAVTPTQWAINSNFNLPALRIRHPLNLVGNPNQNKSVQRDFKILPYQYGMAIEFNGVVECWVGEWSIHKGDFYNDAEGLGNGWGGVLWVGDDGDFGGIRGTARNNLFKGGNVNYGEFSVEKFGGSPNGDFRFRLPSEQNQFQYVYGGKGSTNIVAKISDKGFFIPKAGASSNVAAPEKGQVYFDSTSAEFKGYDGNQWVSFSNSLISGNIILSGNGTDTVYLIEHDLGTIPSYFNVIATSPDAAGISYVTADDNYLKVFYTTAPVAGANNLSWNWQIKK